METTLLIYCTVIESHYELHIIIVTCNQVQSNNKIQTKSILNRVQYSLKTRIFIL